METTFPMSNRASRRTYSQLIVVVNAHQLRLTFIISAISNPNTSNGATKEAEEKPKTLESKH